LCPTQPSFSAFVARVDPQNLLQIGDGFSGVISQARLPEQSLFVGRVNAQHLCEIASSHFPVASFGYRTAHIEKTFYLCGTHALPLHILSMVVLMFIITQSL